jgi:hypothetical protein
MLKRTELREAAFLWIRNLPNGRKFNLAEVYRFLESNYPSECSSRGDAAREPRYKNDGRWAVFDAKHRDRIIKEAARRGEYQRLP